MTQELTPYSCSKPKCFYCLIIDSKPKSRGIDWTNDKLEYLANNWNLMSRYDLEQHLCISMTRIYMKAVELGLGQKRKIYINTEPKNSQSIQDNFGGWF